MIERMPTNGVVGKDTPEIADAIFEVGRGEQRVSENPPLGLPNERADLVRAAAVIDHVDEVAPEIVSENSVERCRIASMGDEVELLPNPVAIAAVDRGASAAGHDPGCALQHGLGHVLDFLVVVAHGALQGGPAGTAVGPIDHRHLMPSTHDDSSRLAGLPSECGRWRSGSVTNCWLMATDA